MFNDASWLAVSGRLLLVAYFLIAAALALRPHEIKHHIGLLTRFRVPFPAASFWAGVAMMWVGCLLILAGWHAELGVYCLIAFTLIANGIYNRFWNESEPMRRHFTMMLLCANTAVIGGLLLVLEQMR